MIDPKDLRIGNYTDKGQIINFYERGIHVGMGKCFDFSEVGPIVLTKEVLLKVFSDKPEVIEEYFSQEQYDGASPDEGISFGFKIVKGILIAKNEELYDSTPVKYFVFKYLHQLQNFMALTGQEFEIKL